MCSPCSTKFLLCKLPFIYFLIVAFTALSRNNMTDGRGLRLYHCCHLAYILHTHTLHVQLRSGTRYLHCLPTDWHIQRTLYCTHLQYPTFHHHALVWWEEEEDQGRIIVRHDRVDNAVPRYHACFLSRLCHHAMPAPPTTPPMPRTAPAMRAVAYHAVPSTPAAPPHYHPTTLVYATPGRITATTHLPLHCAVC